MRLEEKEARNRLQRNSVIAEKQRRLSGNVISDNDRNTSAECYERSVVNKELHEVRTRRASFRAVEGPQISSLTPEPPRRPTVLTVPTSQSATNSPLVSHNTRISVSPPTITLVVPTTPPTTQTSTHSPPPAQPKASTSDDASATQPTTPKDTTSTPPVKEPPHSPTPTPSTSTALVLFEPNVPPPLTYESYVEAFLGTILPTFVFFCFCVFYEFCCFFGSVFRVSFFFLFLFLIRFPLDYFLTYVVNCSQETCPSCEYERDEPG